MPSQLDKLKKYTTVSVDTADIAFMKEFQLENGTTNPSFLSIASQLPTYAHFVAGAIAFAKAHHKKYEDSMNGSEEENIIELAVTKLTVMFGVEISMTTKGRVSVEIDPVCFIDPERIVERAKLLIRLFEDAGLPRNRIYVTIPATWRGIRAAETLEKLDINCNLTLVFSFAQAVACAQAGVSVICPFVGDILDWHTKHHPEKADQFVGAQDPGVILVRNIYDYYKQHGYGTAVMGASFRNTGEILELAGCDKLMISPSLLKELARSNEGVQRKLDPSRPHAKIQKLSALTEADFWLKHNEDDMASEKFSKGSIKLGKDYEEVRDFIRKKL